MMFIIVIDQLSYASDYNHFTPIDFQKLSLEEKKLVPYRLSQAAHLGLDAKARWHFTNHLNNLMYNAASDYVRAIKAFQKDINQSSTGILTLGQIATLKARANFQRSFDIQFPTVHHAWMDDSRAKLQGLLEHSDQLNEWPVNHVQVSCNKVAKVCDLYRVSLIFPNENAWEPGFNVVVDSLRTIDITGWSNSTILGELRQYSDPCRKIVFSFNFSTQEFKRTVSGIMPKQSMSCKPTLLQSDVTHIRDGQEVINHHKTLLKKMASEMTSSHYRKQTH